MKSIIVLAATAFLLVSLVVVQDASAEIEVTLGGGVNAPQGEYGDEVNTGFVLTAGLGYRVVPLLVLGGDVTYSHNKAPDEVTQAVGPGYELTSSIAQYSLVAKLVLPVKQHNVFAKVSWGNYRATAKASGPLGSGELKISDPGYGLGGGFLINSSSSGAFFSDVTWNHVNFDGSDTSYFTITIGALIRFGQSEPSLHDEVQDEIDKLYE